MDPLIVLIMVNLRGYFLKTCIYVHGNVIGSDEGIKLGSTDSKLLGAILEHINGITLGLDVGTNMGYLDGSNDCTNYGTLEGLLLGDSPVYTDGNVFGSDEDIKLELSDGKVLVTVI